MPFLSISPLHLSISSTDYYSLHSLSNSSSSSLSIFFSHKSSIFQTTHLKSPTLRATNSISGETHDQNSQLSLPEQPNASKPSTSLSSFFSSMSKSTNSEGGSLSRMPSTPWMNDEITVPIDRVLDLSKRENHDDDEGTSRDEEGAAAFSKGVRGGRSQKEMSKMIKRMNRLGSYDLDENEENTDEDSNSIVVAGDGFGANLAERLEEEFVGRENIDSLSNSKLPWAGAKRVVFKRRVKRDLGLSHEKLGVSEEEFTRLRRAAESMSFWVKAKKVGVSEEVVEEIRRRWKREELAMVKFDVPLCNNMMRAKEIVEVKTGGLVVWIKKDKLVVYRGTDYHPPPKKRNFGSSIIHHTRDVSVDESACYEAQERVPLSETAVGMRVDTKGAPFPKMVVDETHPSVEGSLFEREANRLLDGLGPRFIDWWKQTPLPVDADMLSDELPVYMTPLRRRPPHLQSTLTDDELTYLRKLAKPLPTHFVLGKNTGLHGLAAAILKLWEKSLIVKIAVKWGILNTSNERMAEELKRLTGGVLLLRNKFFIILYRGKDFIPLGVADAINERESELTHLFDQEENARIASKPIDVVVGTTSGCESTGTLADFKDFQVKYEMNQDDKWEDAVKHEVAKESLEKELRKQERSLYILNEKWKKSESELTKINSKWKLKMEEEDKEMITDEEKQTLRLIGLKMGEVLLLGRRGIYDGLIGSIHQHWKHREVVKVITMQHMFYEVRKTAAILENESGGILISIEKLKKGHAHAIIIFRGKNYRRPSKLLAENLLTKKTAYARSIEVQRRGSLKFFARQRAGHVWVLRHKLESLQQEGELQND